MASNRSSNTLRLPVVLVGTLLFMEALVLMFLLVVLSCAALVLQATITSGVEFCAA
jgi:hypothetical protein